MTYFDIMCKDHIVQRARIDGDLVEIGKYHSRLYNIVEDPKNWLKNRVEHSLRYKVIDLAKFTGLDKLEDYARYAHCVSVTDDIWLRVSGTNLKWHDVSPFYNRISKLQADMAIEGVMIPSGCTKQPSPQYQLHGSVDKCVKRLNGRTGIYMIKSCGEMPVEARMQRPYSEYFVQQLETSLGIKNCVKYEISEYMQDRGYPKPYCQCPIFTSDSVSLVDMSDQIYKHKQLQELKKMFKDNRDKAQYDTLCWMLVLDQLTLNIDRHNSNYGFLYDPDSLNIIGFAPIFDNDCSLGQTVGVRGYSFEEVYDSLINTYPKQQTGQFDETALGFITPEIYKKLLQNRDFRFDFKNIKYLQQQRRDFLNYLINRRINTVIKLTEKTYNIHN